ncbi:MAG TPA: hypothetical protein VIF62_26530 [Labilithrix sp.]
MRTANVSRIARIAAASSLALLLTACPKENSTPMTGSEASEALTESNTSSQASALQSSSIEITTNFTIGKAAQDAAGEIKDYLAAELPCAAVTLADATLTVTYGAKPGNCTYHGHTFSGTHAIHVSKNDQNEVLVDHTWTDLSNGIVKVSGTAHVTWDFSQKFRHVVYDTTWTRIADGRAGQGTGDVTQTPLADGGLANGIQVDGSRTWQGASGKWDLSIQGVQMRWEDPVPQAGKYVLATPKNRSITLAFSRVDDATIQVELSSGDKSFTFDVKGPTADSTPKS